jgi:cob(I)alamin adenosyltransferase
MVVLNRIYTRTGDGGETALGSGRRVPKYDLRIEAYGTVDETNSCIGVARLGASGELDAMLARVQNDLFDLGADLRELRLEYGEPLVDVVAPLDVVESPVAGAVVGHQKTPLLPAQRPVAV